MKKLFTFLILLFGCSFSFSQYTSIHHEQQDFYNAQNKSAEWYEENVNTRIYDFPQSRANCTLNKVVYGWHPYWMGSAYNNYDWNLLSHFSYFSYEVDENTGDPLSTHGWSTADAVDSALANNVKVTLCVTLFGGTKLSNFLTNATAKQTLIDNLINLVQTRGADGVNIDFEGLPSSQKTNFANFMVDLCNQMHTAIPGSEVSTVLYAVDWNDVFDFAIMDPVVDHFIVMGYAYYYQGSSTTGPCDPLYHFGSTYNYTLSRTTTYYLDQGCSANKLVMGLPYYGYEWPTTDLTIPSSTTGSGTARTFAYVKNNTSGNYSAGNYYWDADSYTDIFAFNDGTNKQCYITLEDGFRKRLEHINNTGIAGIGIWALGYDNGYNQLWTAMEDYLTDCQEDPCSGTIHDFGGPTKAYYNNEDYTWTLSPSGAATIDVNFTSFDVEVGYDTLFIYDGNSTAAPLIGAYTGANSPGIFTTSTGDLTFYWKSDGATVGPGWVADYSCVSSSSNPQADFDLPANTNVCQGEIIQFTNTSTNATSYYWEFENGIPATSTNIHPQVYYMQSGSYDVTLYAIDGVDSSTYQQTISLNVANSPQALFSSNSPVYLPNTAIYFTNSSSHSSAYVWNFGDGNVSTDTHPWNDYGAAGVYTVTLISKNFICPDDTTVQEVEVIDHLDLNESSEKMFKVYPNPFTEYFYIDGLIEPSAKVWIYDAAGRLILSREGTSDQLNPFTGLSQLSAGSYIVEIHQQEVVWRMKLLKH
ncbi:MAG: glycosyl hydrolase family 18 protein [Crocinitomicaceae bacterium]